MAEQDIYEVRPKAQNVELNVRYTRAKTYKKVFAKIIDLLLFALVGILFFISARAIVQSSDYYQEVYTGLQEMMVSSGVYVETDDGLEEATEYYNDTDTYSASQIMNNLEKVINQFFSYALELTESGEMSQENYDYMSAIYDEYRLDVTVSEEYLFVIEDGEIVKNSSFRGGYSDYTEYIYVPFIDSYLRGFLISYFPNYYDYTNYLNYVVLLIELPVAVVLSSLLVYLVPPLIFRRTRQTLGMRAYKIGLINSDLLAVKTKKFLLYAVFQIVLEIWLSFLALAVPLLLSITVMVVTKKKQDFAQYMTGTQQVDVSKDKIYLSKEEAEIDNIKINKTPIQFRNISLDEDK